MTSDSGRPARPPLGWRGRFALLGLGLLLVLGVELVLRLFGLGGDAPLLVPFLPAGGDRPALFEVNPELGQNYFSRRDAGGRRLLASHRRELVARPKPEGTLRVLFAGASSIEGFPMPPNLTAARFLEGWLREALPGRQVEVLNLGMAAVASYPVRDIVLRALEETEPDLLLVYAGHNEFYGATGVASTQLAGRSVGAIEAAMRLRRLALTQAIDLAVTRSAAAEAPQDTRGDPDGGNLIEVMAAIDRIEPDGALHVAARRNVTANLTRVVRAARAAGVPVVIGTLVSNESGMAPMASWLEEDDPEVESGEALAAVEAVLATDPTAARAGYEAVLARHPRHAGAVFGLARSLEALRLAAEAAEQYRRARDLDAMPWRASRALNRELVALAEREGAFLAPVEQRFAERSGGANGWDLFVDHVHPSLEGQALLARSFLDVLSERGLVEGVVPAELSDWREMALELGAHPLERYLLIHKMATLFSMPPIGLNNEAAAERFRRALAGMEEAAEPVEREAIRRWQTHSAEAGFALPISLIAARVALEGRDMTRFVIYSRAAILNAFPYSDERCAAVVLSRIAAPLTEGSYRGARLDEAVGECELVATLPGQPSALLARGLGSLLYLAGEEERGREMESRVEGLLPEAPPWMRAYVEEVPDLTRVELQGPGSAEEPDP